MMQRCGEVASLKRVRPDRGGNCLPGRKDRDNLDGSYTAPVHQRYSEIALPSSGYLISLEGWQWPLDGAGS